jgi:hypothetical protein
LKQNGLADQSTLFIYSDGPKTDAEKDEITKIHEVRKIIRKEKWCKEVNIIESPVNLGLAGSIIKGVSEIVNKYGKIIVLEEDLLTSVHFLEYINEGLMRYEKEENILQITGYTYPIKTKFKNESFFLPVGNSLGWGTWKRAWKLFNQHPEDYTILKKNLKIRKKFDIDDTCPCSEMLIRQMEGNIDSWYIKWQWAIFKNQGLALYSDRTLISHIGFDQDATHTITNAKDFNKYWIEKYSINSYPSKKIVNNEYYKTVKKYLKKTYKRNLIFKVKRSIKKLLIYKWLKTNRLLKVSKINMIGVKKC